MRVKPKVHSRCIAVNRWAGGKPDEGSFKKVEVMQVVATFVQ